MSFRRKPGILIFLIYLSLQLPLAAESAAVARVGSEVITEQDVIDLAGKQISQLQQQMYRLKYRTLQQLINQRLMRLEAQARGISTEQLKNELSMKAGVTEEEVATFYESNFSRFVKMSDTEAKKSIRDFLTNRKEHQLVIDFLSAARERYGVAINLEMPPGRSIETSLIGSPISGDETAPVHIAVFSDFQCKFCAETKVKLDQLIEEYQDDLFVKYLHFPSDRHREAFTAAEASECAREQGRFYEYSGRLFQEELNSETYLELATELGLNEQRFSACMSSHEYRDEVIEHIKTGHGLGVDSTPTIVINRQLYQGDMPHDELERIIEKSLVNHDSK